MVYRLSNVDIRLLHVFRAVVECRGFTNAQSVLQVSQPTISSHISELEGRLGIRLCERGRGGFRLTPKGERVYKEAVQLFRSHEDFQNATLELKGKLSGFLNIAVIDNAVTDPVFPFVSALRTFNKRSNEVIFRIEIMNPADIGSAVLERDIDIAIATFDYRMPGLNYEKIYTEANVLACGLDHILFAMEDQTSIREAVRESRKVTRSYVENRDLFPLGPDDGIAHAVVDNLEAEALLILGGGHIGFLPNHYAENWIRKGQMRAILPHSYVYHSDFFIVTRKVPRTSIIVETFLADLREAAAASVRAAAE